MVEGRPVRLVCTGGAAQPPTWADALTDRVRYLGLDDVHFPGYVDGEDLRALYRAATAVITPSLAEGGAYIAQEAVVHGTAVANANIASARAHLARMELDVPTFDPYDVDEIASTIAAIVDDPDTIVAGYGPAAEIISTWTWDGLADDVLSSLDRVVA